MIWSVGHSNRTIEAFCDVLASAAIEHVVDVRSYPRSKRYPQFDRGPLGGSLHVAGLDYRHARALGGMRRPHPDSPNTALREEGFRGYADHMASAEFVDALDALEVEARTTRIALMCAEASPWHCHRQFLSDALSFRGLEVRHLIDAERFEAHRRHPQARFRDRTLSYPGLF